MSSKAPVDLSVDSAAINSSAVTINAEGVAATLQALRDASATDRQRLMVVLPLKWDNLEQEATFHMLLHILNITSGAEVPALDCSDVQPSLFTLLSSQIYVLLQARSHEPDRYMAGIREIVLMGLLGMHMEGRKLTASGLAGLSLFDFSRAFSLPLTVEKEVMPGVRQDVPAPHRPLVETMHRTLQDGCRILGERNFTRYFHGPLLSVSCPPHKLFAALVSVFCLVLIPAMFLKLSRLNPLMPWLQSRVSSAFSHS